jgi:hypothetical protein
MVKTHVFLTSLAAGVALHKVKRIHLQSRVHTCKDLPEASASVDVRAIKID